jgi:hypothetical protein
MGSKSRDPKKKPKLVLRKSTKKMVLKRPPETKKPIPSKTPGKPNLPKTVVFVKSDKNVFDTMNIKAPNTGVIKIRAPKLDPTESFQDKLVRMTVDPEELLAMVMMGDVVGLGLMSQEELDAEAIYNTDGIPLKPSGRDIARSMMDGKIRLKAICEAIPYLRAKKADKSALPGSSAPGTEGEERVNIYIPDNGRSK